jgi:Kef-type K+ transport system membrane component KefB
VLSVIGLGFLLLLAGLEIDFARLRGQVLRLTVTAFGLSAVLAIGVGTALHAGGLLRSPLLIAVILSATSLGIILPPLDDSGQATTPFGQVIVAGASIAEVAPVVALSVLFSGDSPGTWSQVALLLVLAAVATAFGLEAILGAFVAGATLKLLDRDEGMTHSLLPVKLRAVGFGAFVPFFFVSTGMGLNVHALFTDPAVLARVPVFLGTLLLVRALPALAYRPLAERKAQLVAAGLLQATSLSIPIVGGTIGVSLGLIRPENYVALVAAGLICVVAFPPLAPAPPARARPRRGLTRAGTVGGR